MLCPLMQSDGFPELANEVEPQFMMLSSLILREKGQLVEAHRVLQVGIGDVAKMALNLVMGSGGMRLAVTL